jgi:hypothetical protein
LEVDNTWFIYDLTTSWPESQEKSLLIKSVGNQKVATSAFSTKKKLIDSSPRTGKEEERLLSS